MELRLRGRGRAPWQPVRGDGGDAGNELQLYVAPVNWKPDNPPVPMSSPASFAGQLFDTLGYYRTLGWAEATWAWYGAASI